MLMLFFIIIVKKGFRMSKDEKLTLIDKLGKIQVELKAPKKQLNKFGGYNYRSLEDILEALKPLIKKHQISLIMNDELINIGERYYIKATASIYGGESSRSASGYAREAEHKKGMDESQLTGSTSSYARKYALNGLFCIDDTKDADHYNEHSKDPVTPKTVSSPKSLEKGLCDCGTEISGNYKKCWKCNQK